ncbi:MAG: YkoF family thiamine/hydroxymethylpyrimidine-binding protein [Bacteroidota bacterium]
MDISVELTLTPLQNDFEPPIIDFIQQLRKSGLTVLENPLSTQVYGPYDGVMEVLQEQIKTTFEDLEHVVLTMKMVKSNRSGYEPHF